MMDSAPFSGFVQAKKVLETGLEAMDLELDASETAPGLVIEFEDLETFEEKIKSCRFVRNPLYNDCYLVDREIANNLLTAVIHCSR